MKKTPWIIGFLLLLFCGHGEAATEVRTIPTRAGVTMEFLYMAPEGPAVRDALILLPGGNGTRPYRLLADNVVQGWGFLVRSSSEFLKQGLALAVASPPSDHSTGMTGDFRESEEHALDIADLAAHLASRGHKRIFLVGHSRGTISAAALVGHLPTGTISGVVLASSLDYEEFMRWLPLESIDLPVLMLHNVDDSCRVSPFPEAIKTRDALRRHTAVDFVEFSGGAASMSLPCDNLSTHGFFGLDGKVVRVIADWIKGRKVPERVE